jgi:REP element-mobilizing transposase RayT
LARQHSTLRLPAWDYASPGAYFLTLVTAGRELLFDDSRYRQVAEDTWRWLGEHFADVVVDEFVVMPNHLHGVLILNGVEIADSRPSRRAPTAEGVAQMRKVKPVGRLVGAFKTVSTNRINQMRGTPGTQVWQRNFYDRVVRSERELDRIRRYIYDNPAMWAEDPENPTAVFTGQETESAVGALREGRRQGVCGRQGTSQ